MKPKKSSWRRQVGVYAVFIVLLSFSVRMLQLSFFSGKGIEIFVISVPPASPGPHDKSGHIRFVPQEAVIKKGEHWYVYVVEQKTNYWMRGTYALRQEVIPLEQGMAGYKVSVLEEGDASWEKSGDRENRNWRVVLHPQMLKGKWEQKVQLANP